MQDARIGTIVGDRYKILERISEGAMGVVYRAERTQLGRVVAVKFLHTGLAATPEFIRRFELEARTMSRLNHPHCVSVIDFGVADAPFIVMDYVTGTTLRELLDQTQGPIPAGRALHVVRQVLAGLAHAHQVGIIHRDIKAANVMLAQLAGTGDHVRLLDFGLAKLLDADQSASRHVIGTPSYMSPEQAQSKPVDGRSDIYAVTVLLFELLTGEKPFWDDDLLKVVRMHIHAPPPALREKAPEIGFSKQLEAVIARGLAKAPGDRFQTPEEMAEAFDHVPEAMTRDSGPVAARRTPASSVREDASIRAALRASRSSGRRVLGWIVVLAVIAGGVVVWDQLGRPGMASNDAPATGKPSTTQARAAEIAQLEDQQRKHPKDWSIPFRLGRLYTEHGRRADGIAAYARAIDGAGRYRWNARLTNDMIDALGDAATRDLARTILIEKIGEPALPHLKTAQGAASRPDAVRREVTAVIAAIERQP